MSNDVPLIPREALFGNPERASPRISPDGRRLAWLAPDDGILNVWVGEADLSAARPITGDRDRGVRTVAWAHDHRHVLYVQDEGGDENWRLHAVDLETGHDRDLTPFEDVQARVVELDKRYPDDVLVGLNRDNPELHDVYRLHLPTGHLERVLENPGFVGFVVDTTFRVRAGVEPQPDGGHRIMVRDDAEGDWRPLLDVLPEDALTTDPVAFDRDGERLLAISSVGANTGRLVSLDLATGAEEGLAEDPRHDVTDVRLDPDTRQVQWVSFLRDRLDHEPIDASIADELAALTEAERGDLLLLDEDDADATWVVAYQRDDGPMRYHRYDRTSRALSFLFEVRPALGGYELARMEPFRVTARDGLELPGYLTVPPRAEPRNLPTVLLVHGGPFARDAWGYHPEVQWLANRGYLVLQVNFRGSTGYGKAFVNAGDREWGAAMHDDLLDTVDWAIDQGYADPARVAIYGGSYGGYAALCGAAFTPERFACAVDLVGISNLKTLIESFPPYWKPIIAQFHARVGHPEHDEAFLWERSPLSRADRVSIPLLIAQGANDPRVKQAESEQFVEALRAHGIDHEYLLFEDEGHGFAKPENRMRFYAAAEAFLARHLGGRQEP
ncbi:S9 family peptidase [Egibacter rhizosphaerae]|uniref:S9 family peptidase n=1 Tax=Egibacter rhizosphaerae TaxID=1670831 RepID=A0A411YBZ5_9ACTN|nr:S9 family peptidase [Egibacter rhizosphaerae]QBI18724.1 S9 family peptidase [Egibacter rhizosphaerae]